ncbi:hypothetical protein BJ165DRAFT_991616 [Panaeolus papilionaceus]|nr:hypothetical protein BJ165DRAFT_991616 [Panaeolus papilionaceus]
MATKSIVEPSIPFLPPELERKIFEVAVESLSINLPPCRSALDLQLVAKRVQLWLRPLLYSVYKCTNQRDVPFPNFEANPALKVEEIGPLIKHLLYAYDPQDDVESAVEVLYYCPFVENVAIWIDPTACGNINSIKHSFQHLKRLSARFSSFSHSQLRSPFMLGLTHLEIHSGLRLGRLALYDATFN